MSNVEQSAVLDHIIAEAPPWMESERTVCGRPLNDVGSAVPEHVIAAKVTKHGQQRTAFSTCMTCMTTISSRPRWETAPTQFVNWYTQGAWRATPDRDAEWVALAALVAAHPEEFAAHLQAVRGDDLSAARAKRRPRVRSREL